MTSPLDDEKTPSFDMCNCRNFSALHDLRSRRQMSNFSSSSVDTYFEDRHLDQRAASPEREAFKLARAQPENRGEQKEKEGGTLKRKKQMMGD